MHHVNHWYGHANVFARWCGLDPTSSPRVWGYLQHGWNIGDGWDRTGTFIGHHPLFVWSQLTRRRAISLGRRNVCVTGAPWLYLLELEPDLGRVPEPERTGTLWYPFHGWERQGVRGSHRRLADQIRDVETGPVTVCLYWYDFRNRSVRRLYERRGFDVICHGERGWLWKGTDTAFLARQLTAQRRHRRVASNRLSTAIFYGIAAGCEPAVYGDPMVLAAEDLELGSVARLRREWPELHGEAVGLEPARRIAAAELGADHIAPPTVLRELFGWPSGEEAA